MKTTARIAAAVVSAATIFAVAYLIGTLVKTKDDSPKHPAHPSHTMPTSQPKPSPTPTPTASITVSVAPTNSTNGPDTSKNAVV